MYQPTAHELALNLVAENCQRKPHTLKPEDRLVDDLGMDDLDLEVLRIDLEDVLNCVVADEEPLETVAHVVAFIEKQRATQ